MNKGLITHKDYCNYIHDVYVQKNKAYGNSFGISCDKYGITAALVRMSDKWNRLNQLALNPDIPVGDESIQDTLLDLANYCIMTAMWCNENMIEEEKGESSNEDQE